MLLRLSGMPMRMMACADPELGPPIGDLSGDAPRLTKLGIDCRGIRWLHSDDNGCPLGSWMWHELLPGALEELELLGLQKSELVNIKWAAAAGAAVAAGLPRLRTLRVTSSKDEWAARGEPLRISNVPLLRGFAAPLHLEVRGSGMDVVVYSHLFDQVGSVRIVAGGRISILWGNQDNVAVFVDCLCPAGLQAAELCAERHIDLSPCAGPLNWQVVREMMSRCGDRFAFDLWVSDEADDGGDRDKADIRRLAWRRWPAPDAPDLPAAKAAHEHARQWAASFS